VNIGKIEFTNINVDKILTVACVGAVLATFACGIWTGVNISNQIETRQETKTDEQKYNEIAKVRFADYNQANIIVTKRASDPSKYYYDTWTMGVKIVNISEKNSDPYDLGLYTAYNYLDLHEPDKGRDRFMNELIFYTTRHSSFDEYLISGGHIDEEGKPSVTKWKESVKEYKNKVIHTLLIENDISNLYEQQNNAEREMESSKNKLYTKEK